MTMYFGDDVTLLFNDGEGVKVGTAEVWPIRSREIHGFQISDRPVGRLILREGRVFVRDLTSCGDLMPVPYGQTFSMTRLLAYAASLLFA